MTSKEAYNVLLQAWQGNKEAENYPSFDDINEALYTIKQDLERLGELEKENQELKKKVKTYEDLLHTIEEEVLE